MPDPAFWVVVVLAAVLLTTSHLCLGFVFGRRTASREVVRKTRNILSEGIAHSTSHESVTDRLLKEVERAVAVCRSMPEPPRASLEKVLGEAILSIVSLRDALHESTAMQKDALHQLAKPKGGPARSNGFHGHKARLVLEVEDDVDNGYSNVAVATANRPREPRHATATTAKAAPAKRAATATGNPERKTFPRPPPVAAPQPSVLPSVPATSLSPEEVERMRTGSTTVEDTRRDEARFPYCVPQFIAEIHGKSFPRPEEFVRVMCRDIARNGVSFFTTAVPDSDELIISLGVPPNLTFLSLRVINHRLTTLDGVSGYTVGCTFVARVGPGIYAWNAERDCVDVDRDEPPAAEGTLER